MTKRFNVSEQLLALFATLLLTKVSISSSTVVVKISTYMLFSNIKIAIIAGIWR